MKTLKEVGGPVAPFTHGEHVWCGETLRDSFARKAMECIMKHPSALHLTPDNFAVLCWDLADAMIRVRGA